MEANLKAAFAGEPQARNKYAVFASRARGEGYGGIARIFEETAANEFTHASLCSASLAGRWMPRKTSNRRPDGENYEWTDMYARFAADARAEDFAEIARLFEELGKIERRHEERYSVLLGRIGGAVSFRSGKSGERLNCGYRAENGEAPNRAPSADIQKPISPRRAARSPEMPKKRSGFLRSAFFFVLKNRPSRFRAGCAGYCPPLRIFFAEFEGYSALLVEREGR